MPITTSAKKAIRSSTKKKIFNLRKKNQMTSVVKQYKKLVDSKDSKGAEKLLPTLQKAIDKAAKTGLIKKNTAARKKSRLMKKLAK
jgi:small subunit ribosomal protein S20